MAQELGLIPKEETYTNPYREKKTPSTVATKTVWKKSKAKGAFNEGQRHELWSKYKRICIVGAIYYNSNR